MLCHNYKTVSTFSVSLLVTEYSWLTEHPLNRSYGYKEEYVCNI